MNRSIRPRLQTPLKMIAGGLVATAIAVAVYGWLAGAVLAPIALPAVTLFAGWVIYHDHRGDQDTDSHPGRDPMPTH